MKTSAIPINQTISELYGFLGLELSKNAEAFYIGTHEGIRGALPEAITPFRNAFSKFPWSWAVPLWNTE